MSDYGGERKYINFSGQNSVRTSLTNVMSLERLSELESKRFEIRLDIKDVKATPIFSSIDDLEKFLWEKYTLRRGETPNWIEIKDPEVRVAFDELLRPAVSLLFHLVDSIPKQDRNVGIPPYGKIVKAYNDIIKMLLDFVGYATNFRRIDVDEILLIKKRYLDILKEATLLIEKTTSEYSEKYGLKIYEKLTPFVKKNVFSLSLEERKIYEWNILNIQYLYNLIRGVVLNQNHKKFFEVFEENLDENRDVLVAYSKLVYDFVEKFKNIIYDKDVVESIVQKNEFGEIAYIIVRDEMRARINIGIAGDDPNRLPRIDFDAIEELLKSANRPETPLEIRLEFKNDKHREMLPLHDVDEITINHVYKPVRVRGVVGKLQPKIARLWRVRVYDKDSDDGWKYRYILLPQVLYTERGTKAKILPAVDNIRIESQYGELQLFPEELEKSRKASTSLKFVLEGSLVDVVLPGERYEFVGIPFYQDPAKDGDIVLYVTDVRRIDILDSFKVTEEDVKRFKEIKKKFETEKRQEVEEFSRRVGLKIPPMVYVYLKSFAPEVRLTKSNVMLKLAFLIPAVRGALKNTREIPHSLIIGEPSTGKTHIAKELAKIHPKALYVSGKSATGIGLTVSVNKDKLTGQWYATPGAIVLADGGVLIIDELDKANKEDRSNLYEALEDSKVTVAKATVFKTMPARTSVIGIANPPSYTIRGVNDVRAIFKKAGFDPAFVSRFDIIVVALDETEYQDDIEDAISIFKHVTGQKFDTVMDYNELRKLLLYSMSLRPEIPQELAGYLAEKYAELRQKARDTGNDAYKIKKRNLEGILRIATALAKLNLDTKVTTDHIDLAIQIFEYSQNIRKEAEKEINVSKKEVREQVMSVILSDNIKFVDEKGFKRIAQKIVEKFNYDESLTDQIETIVSDLITKTLVREKVAEFDADKNGWRIKINTLTEYLGGVISPEDEFLMKSEEEKVAEVKGIIEGIAKNNDTLTEMSFEAVKVELKERYGNISDALIERLIQRAVDELVKEGKLSEYFRNGQIVYRVVKKPPPSMTDFS